MVTLLKALQDSLKARSTKSLPSALARQRVKKSMAKGKRVNVPSQENSASAFA